MKNRNPNITINDENSKTYGEKMLMRLYANTTDVNISEDPEYKAISETIMCLAERMVQPPICKYKHTVDGHKFKEELSSSIFNTINNRSISPAYQLECLIVCDDIAIMTMTYMAQHWKAIQKMHYRDGIYIRRNTNLCNDPICWDYTISLKPNLIERLKILKLKLEVMSK